MIFSIKENVPSIISFQCPAGCKDSGPSSCSSKLKYSKKKEESHFAYYTRGGLRAGRVVKIKVSVTRGDPLDQFLLIGVP